MDLGEDDGLGDEDHHIVRLHKDWSVPLTLSYPNPRQSFLQGAKKGVEAEGIRDHT
jgi:hypothetical protein